MRAHVTVAGASSIPKSWKLKIPGEHNRMDAGIAAAAARAFGIDDADIQSAVESFEGVPGRLQFLREVRGVKIYNDTTATVPEATVAALEALDPEKKQNILLIVGGADKGLDMKAMQPAVHAHGKKVYFLAGSGTERVKGPEDIVYDSLKAAVDAAVADAASGDIILLSPAFASFGMFKNEFDRGDQFSAIVASLPE